MVTAIPVCGRPKLKRCCSRRYGQPAPTHAARKLDEVERQVVIPEFHPPASDTRPHLVPVVARIFAIATVRFPLIPDSAATTGSRLIGTTRMKQPTGEPIRITGSHAPWQFPDAEQIFLIP